MGNAYASGAGYNVLRGTINATGTLTQELDLGDYTLARLIFSNATNGTLTFQASAYSDSNTNPGYTSSYNPIYDDAGASVSITLPSGAGAISGDKLNFLAGFRYVKIKTTPAQATGCLFLLPVKV